MLGSPKTIPAVVALPRSISSIAISVGALALFLVVASYCLILNPIGIDRSRKSELAFANVNSTTDLVEETKSLRRDGNGELGKADGFEQARTLSSDGIRDVSLNDGDIVKDSRPSSAITPFESSNSTEKTAPVSLDESNNDRKIDSAISDDSSTIPLNSTATAAPVSSVTSDNGSSTIALNSTSINAPVSSATLNNGGKVDSGASNGGSSFSLNSTTMLEPVSSIVTNKPEKDDSRSCNLYHGTWFHDSSGPLYTNNTCPIITQMQNCQGNGRPDKDYENWRWKPDQCDLPRFDPKKFFKLMQGKTLAFMGDSVARNQFESMLCILWQEEAPINRGNRKMQRWFFRSASVNIVRIWSSWLVHKTSEPFQFAPEGVDKLHLDVPDEVFMEFIPKFDVVVLSSGHWFAKQSVYIVNNEIIGGQLWWPDKTRKMKIDNVKAYSISVETILSAMVTHPNYTGLTIVRSYSPDHYEGGAWNTGGSCTGKVRPAVAGELAVNQFTDTMHEKQVMGFEKAIKKVTNKSKLRLMDITDAFGYRPDGHPGPYRNPDPNKKTKRGPHGEPPPQDCLHWCMPGPVDTWNELVLEIIRREFEG